MTIAQQLGVKEFPFSIKDSKGNEIYSESSEGYWWKSDYDSMSVRIYYEDSDGYWIRFEYDSNGKQIYHKDSKGYWWKREYDSAGKEIYYEDSKGTCVSYSPKFITELTLDQIADKFNIPVSSLKIKK